MKIISLFKNVCIFLLTNFGPLVGFYLVNMLFGFKTAVLVSIGLVFIELIILKMKKQKITSFFYFSSAIIIVFGIADLFIKQPFFFKFEATLTNLFFAVFFGMSLFKEKSIVQEFAEMQKRTSEQQNPDKQFFFKVFTIFWCLYFITKAVFYLWINLNTSLDEGLIIRMVVGKLSFWIMMFVSIGLPKQIWKAFEGLKLFPSQRENRISKI